jgi:hypothetical protein
LLPYNAEGQVLELMFKNLPLFVLPAQNSVKIRSSLLWFDLPE